MHQVKRLAAYILAGMLGFVVGATVGISGHNCSHPDQPPFWQCVTEDPQDTFVPAVALSLLALSVVAAIDLGRRGSSNAQRTEYPGWRRWLYAVLLFSIAVPSLRIAFDRAVGSYPDTDPIHVSIIGTWVLTPLIVVEFIIWVVRHFRGFARMTPVAIVSAVGVVLYLTVPESVCIQDSIDTIGCYGGGNVYVAHYAVLCSMVACFFLWPKAARGDSVGFDDRAESIHA